VTAVGPAVTAVGRTEVVAVHPAPEPAVLTAIVAAVEEAWPRPQPRPADVPRLSAWRFSGRWWAKPQAVRRDRPG
jgi:hypothetical protein